MTAPSSVDGRDLDEFAEHVRLAVRAELRRELNVQFQMVCKGLSLWMLGTSIVSAAISAGLSVAT